jgi:hypothetical protein
MCSFKLGTGNTAEMIKKVSCNPGTQTVFDGLIACVFIIKMFIYVYNRFNCALGDYGSC